MTERITALHAADAAWAQRHREHSDTERSVSPLCVTDPTGFQDQPIPERRWVVPGWIPWGYVTGLYGPSTTGKSLLAQQLMTAAAIRKPWIGLDIAPVRTLAVFCEDDDEELQRRQADINRFYEVSFRDLSAMRWIARVGYDNVLMRFSGGEPETTRFFDQLLAEARAFEANFIIVDTVADTFGGNHNDPFQARQFVQMALGRIGREIGGSVLACAHPSRPGQSSGEGDGYSVQWDATFRARAFLSRPKSNSGETVDESLRMLSRRSSNYGPLGEPIDLRWEDGLFVPVHQDTGITAYTKRQSCERVFLDLLRDAEKSKRRLSDSKNTANYAPRVFANDPRKESFKVADFEVAMASLFASGAITMGGKNNRDRRIICTEGALRGVA